MTVLQLVSGGGLTRPPIGSVLVTPPDSLTGETFCPEIPQCETPPFFVDWLSISQVHPGAGLPRIDAGTVLAVDTDGELVWKSCRAVEHAGSYDTSVNVRCDGERVTLSGNLSRFGRRDNLFGFGFTDCMQRANELLAHFHLPPFTAGGRVELSKRGRERDVEYAWTGARISRIDLTANYAAGNAEDAHAFMQWLGSQHSHRQEGRTLGQGETVAFGAGSRRAYWKAYLKALELKRHEGADERVIEWCDAVGLVRFEGTLRSNLLTEVGAAYLGDYERGHAMGQLSRIFNERSAVLARATAATDDLDALPRHLRATARDYLAGMDCAARMSRASFFRHRSALLPYGLDIAVRNVRPFTPRVRVVELARVEPPSWYQLAA